MSILYEIPEHLLKQAALIASKYDDRSISDIIEECFFYGAKSLYSDAPKPKTGDYATISNLTLERLNNARKEYSQYLDNTSDNDDIGEYSDTYSKPILNENGLFEL